MCDKGNTGFTNYNYNPIGKRGTSYGDKGMKTNKLKDEVINEIETSIHDVDFKTRKEVLDYINNKYKLTEE